MFYSLFSFLFLFIFPSIDLFDCCRISFGSCRSSCENVSYFYKHTFLSLKWMFCIIVACVRAQTVSRITPHKRNYFMLFFHRFVVILVEENGEILIKTSTFRRLNGVNHTQTHSRNTSKCSVLFSTDQIMLLINVCVMFVNGSNNLLSPSKMQLKNTLSYIFQFLKETDFEKFVV